MDLWKQRYGNFLRWRTSRYARIQWHRDTWHLKRRQVEMAELSLSHRTQSQNHWNTRKAVTFLNKLSPQLSRPWNKAQLEILISTVYRYRRCDKIQNSSWVLSRIDKMFTVVATHFHFFTRKILTHPTQPNCHSAERLIGLWQLGWVALMNILLVKTHILFFFWKVTLSQENTHPT